MYPRRSIRRRPAHADLGILEEGLTLVVAMPGLLSALDRLCLFQCCKDLASVVLRGSKTSRMSLHKAPQQGRNNRAHIMGAMELAAHSSSLALVMTGVMVSPAPCVWSHVSSIELKDVELASQGLSCLHLSNLPSLRALRIKDCEGHALRGRGLKVPCAAAGGRGCSSKGRRAAASRPCCLRSLEVTGCLPLGAVLQHLTPWIGSEDSQLQQLTVDDLVGLDVLPQLRQLQSFHLLPSEPPFWVVSDTNFKRLLSLPNLKELRLPQLTLDESYTHHPCNWGALYLYQGASTLTLASLPLAGIKKLVITKSIRVNGEVEEAVANCGHCADLTFEPTETTCPWQPTEPTFHVVSTHLQEDMPREEEDALLSALPSLLTLCAARLARPGALALGHIGLLAPVVEALAALPANVRSLGLQMCSCFPLGDIAPSLINRLPASVGHMVLHGQFDLDELFELVSGASRPMRITFHGVESSVEGWESVVVTAGLASGAPLELAFFM